MGVGVPWSWSAYVGLDRFPEGAISALSRAVGVEQAVRAREDEIVGYDRAEKSRPFMAPLFNAQGRAVSAVRFTASRGAKALHPIQLSRGLTQIDATVTLWLANFPGGHVQALREARNRTLVLCEAPIDVLRSPEGEPAIGLMSQESAAGVVAALIALESHERPARIVTRVTMDGWVGYVHELTEAGFHVEPIRAPAEIAEEARDAALDAEVFSQPNGRLLIYTARGWVEYTREGAVNALTSRGWTVDRIKGSKDHFRDTQGLTFDPTTTARVTMSKYGEPLCNTYRGLPMVPAKGDWTPVRDLIGHLTGGDEAAMEYALDWFGGPIKAQYASELAGLRRALRCRSTILFHGRPGAGKGWLLEVMRAIYGETYALLTQHQLEDAFDIARISRSLFIVADEVGGPSGMNSKAFQRAKGWITEDEVNVRNMRVQADIAQMYANIVFFSNFAMPFKLDLDDRRFSVFWRDNPIPPGLVKTLQREKATGWPSVRAFLFHVAYERPEVTRDLWVPYDNADRRRLLAASRDAVHAFAEDIASQGWLTIDDLWIRAERASRKMAGDGGSRIESHDGESVLVRTLCQCFREWRKAYGYEGRESSSAAAVIDAMRRRIPGVRTGVATVGGVRAPAMHGVPLVGSDGVRVVGATTPGASGAATGPAPVESDGSEEEYVF